MLQNIRDHAQGVLAWIIVGLIAIPFALWGVHEYLRPTYRDIVAEVNGIELSRNEFRANVHQRQRQLQAMFKNNIDLSFMKERLEQDTLNQMIETEVLVQNAVKAGLRVSDAWLAQSIHAIPTFQEQGNFSQTRYEAGLRNLGMSPVVFEAEQRRELLTGQIQKGIMQSAFLTSTEQQRQTRLEKQQRFLSYITISKTRFIESVTVTDEEIQAYYKEHATQYMTPERVSIEYAELSQKDLKTEQAPDEKALQDYYQQHLATYTTPASWHARHILVAVNSDAKPEEVSAAEKKINELADKIKAGQPFAEVAKAFSNDPGSATNGGDLGWFGPSAMVKPFEDTVKTLPINTLSSPVRTQFGFHLIEVLESKPEEVKPFETVRQEIEATVQKEQVELVFDKQVEQFANLAFEHPDSLDVLTQTLNLQKKSTGLFARDGLEPKDPILAHRKVIETAFSNAVLKDGFNSELIDIGDEQVIVLRAKDHELPQPKPLETVKEEITATLKQQKAETEVKTLGKTLLTQLKESDDPAVLVKTHDLAWSTAQWVQREESRFPQPAVVKEVFKMGYPPENKGLYQGIELESGDYALIALLAVKDGVETPPADKDQKDKAEDALQLAWGESDFNYFLAGLKAKAKIVTHIDDKPQNP